MTKTDKKSENVEFYVEKHIARLKTLWCGYISKDVRLEINDRML